MSIKRTGDEWEATCDHVDEKWVIRRATWHLAYRSVRAHQRECLFHALRIELPDEDEHHPVSVLGIWARMLSEDYGVDCPDLLDLSATAAFLDGIIGKVAQDEHQDFPLLAREIRKCRSHMEAVLRDSTAPERGAPCPDCVATGKVDPAKTRLQRWYPHWCDDPDCEQIHDATDASDWWVCPRDPSHKWKHRDYVRWIAERKAVGA